MEIETEEQPGMGDGPEEKDTSKTNEQVTHWLGVVSQSKEYFKDVFKYMLEDQQFARGVQWPGQKKPRGEDRYIANIVHRHLRQREAALYAKNPTAVAKRRETLDFVLWDGDMQSLQMAQQTVMQFQQMMQQAVSDSGPAAMNDPMMVQMGQQAQQAQELIEDYQIGSQYRQRVAKMGETLEIVWEHQIGEQQPPFKRSMKKLVRRTLTTGVGYAKVGYHRFQESRPEDQERVTDLTEQISALEAKMAEAQDHPEDYEEDSLKLAELENLLEKVTQDQMVYAREGLDIDFPQSTSIIVDKQCRDLDGFVGARWVAQEYKMTPKQIRETYKVDVSENFTAYDDQGQELTKDTMRDMPDEKKDGAYALVWEIWDKHHAQMMTVCDGYNDFLTEPKTPAVSTERFWPFFTLMFNPVEDDENIYPPSDVELLRPMQTERNLMRQRMREHRDASRPGYVAPRGRLEITDKNKLENRNAHDVIELNGLTEQDDIRRILQAIPSAPIDPNQYETGSLDEDVFRSVGTQEAVMGGSSGASATETSIGESARLTAIGSNIDDLDDFLTEMTRISSHIMLTQMDAELVKEIAGRGAVWTEQNTEDVARDLWLEIRAGSSGRPNKSAEIQNLERVMPFLLQMPGLKPKKLAEKTLERLDDRLDIDEMFDVNLPSVMAQNRMDQMPADDPAAQQDQQGGEGGDQTSTQQGDSNLGPRPPEEPRVMDPNRA